MPQFTEGQSVTVRPDSRAVQPVRQGGRIVRHHLASSAGTIVPGARPDAGFYRVSFDFGEWGSFVATLDHRELEA